jgi:hypothetical protein
VIEEVTGMQKRSSAIISLVIFVAAIVAQAAFIAYLGRAGEVYGYLETAIVQIYRDGR